MRKISIKNTRLKKPSRKIKPGMGVDTYNPTEALLDVERIERAILECLENDDAEGVIEVIQVQLEAYNKTYLPKSGVVA